MTPSAAKLDHDLRLQDELLNGVSRSFAFTTPQLPAGVREPAGTGYLICRIADTIEDETALDARLKREFSERWVDVVDGKQDAESFSADLGGMLSGTTTEMEHRLVACIPRVIEMTRRFDRAQQDAIRRCVARMARGMSEFQENAGPGGLVDLQRYHQYCYYVAGVYGELLTELFCLYSASLARRKTQLMPLAVSYGQGLQMTNILKDLWEDQGRGVCWLPRDVLLRHGLDPERLSPGCTQPGFVAGLNELVGIAYGHLQNASAYIRLIPGNETGIRRYCLWSVAMAILTLRRIHRFPQYTCGQDVKISRWDVRLVIASTSVLVKSNSGIAMLFRYFGRDMPCSRPATGCTPPPPAG